MKELKLEVRKNFIKDHMTEVLASRGILITTPTNEDFWLFKVPLSNGQAVVGFPKFRTIGIGFLKEEYDWNCNFPYTTDAKETYEHIKDNRRPAKERKPTIIKAIKMIQEACEKYNWE